MSRAVTNLKKKIAPLEPTLTGTVYIAHFTIADKPLLTKALPLRKNNNQRGTV